MSGYSVPKYKNIEKICKFPTDMKQRLRPSRSEKRKKMFGAFLCARVFGTIRRETSKDSVEWQWCSVKRNTLSFLLFLSGLQRTNNNLCGTHDLFAKIKVTLNVWQFCKKNRIIGVQLEILKDSLLFIPVTLFANFYSIYSEGIWETRECLHKHIQAGLYCFYIKAVALKQGYLHPTSQH